MRRQIPYLAPINLYQGTDVIEKITDFLLAHGFKIMIAGFALSAAGMILLIQAQHNNVSLQHVAFGLVGTGLGLYVIGRIFVIGAQRRTRKLREQARENSSEEEKN
jgi:hypothetical protein